MTSIIEPRVRDYVAAEQDSLSCSHDEARPTALSASPGIRATREQGPIDVDTGLNDAPITSLEGARNINWDMAHSGLVTRPSVSMSSIYSGMVYSEALRRGLSSSPEITGLEANKSTRPVLPRPSPRSKIKRIGDIVGKGQRHEAGDRDKRKRKNLGLSYFIPSFMKGKFEDPVRFDETLIRI